MYRLDRMRKDYERFTAAEGYIIGFPVGEDIYCAMIDKIPRRYCTIQKECSSHGGGLGLYISIKNKKKKNELLRKKDTFYLCKLSDLNNKEIGNRGKVLEKLLAERFNVEWRGSADKEPFYKCGDLVINGKEIQVKYEHARICYDKTLKKLQKRA